ncbi:MAG TPA: DUF6314 family protein, partial [Microlunatus sp.]|nr:DUF6314 family protein [Microlunatus sp.]
HPWLPGRPVRHPCGADLYSGRIDAARTDPLRDAWTVHWVVTGPNKDYTMTTEISRGPGVISSPVGT